MRTQYFAVALACLLALLIFAGCGGGGSNGGTISLQLTDAPMDGVEKVEISISKIIAHQTGGGPVVLKEYETPLEIDLLQYRYDGTTESTYPLLSETPLTPGKYTWIRLELTEASVTVGGIEHQIDLTNLDQRGVQFIHPFEVADNTKVGLLLDFNAGKSIKTRQDGVYWMNPVTAMMPVVLAGSVIGTVEFKDGSGNVVAVPEGATVDAYKPGDTVLAGSGLVNTDGAFAIPALEMGAYDLKVTAAGYDEAAVVKAGVVVNSGDQTDVGLITVTPAP